MLIIGKRGTGKTTLTADILYHMRKVFDWGVCFSATEEANGFWGRHMCSEFIYPAFEPDVLTRYIEFQRNAASSSREQRNESSSSKPMRSFLLFEDTMYSRCMKNNLDIRALFFNGRHWFSTLFITMQYMLDIPADLRSQVDYVFILRNNITVDREKLYRYYCGFLPNFHVFQSLMNSCTNDFDCLVVDNTSRSNNVTDNVFWYRAETHKYKLGGPAVWKYHEHMREQAAATAAAARDKNKSGGKDKKEREQEVEDIRADANSFFGNRASQRSFVPRNQEIRIKRHA